MKKRSIFMLTLALTAVCLSGCQSSDSDTKQETQTVTEAATEDVTEAVTETEVVTEAATETETEAVAEAATETETEVVSETERESSDASDAESELAAIAAAGPFGAFETQTLEGDAVTQEIFAEADLTMVNIWGTFCSPCINEMPDLGELAKEYEEKGLQMVGIISDVTAAGDETATLIVEETGADYTHLVLSETLYYSLSQIQVVPTTVFIDSTGKQVGYTYTGSRSKEDWAAIMDEMLQEAGN